MILVMVESPFAAPTPEGLTRNIAYARAAIADCFRRDEAGFASHLLYTQEGILEDTIREQRMLGITAGLEWSKRAHRVAVYIDLGISRGMREALAFHEARGAHVRTRSLGAPWSDLAPSDAFLHSKT